MKPKIKNIIIFVAAAVVLILVYVLFLKPAPEEANLTTTSGNSAMPGTGTTNTADQNNTIGANFLATLLSVKNITLDDSIFTDPAFATLRDSSIVLVPDQTQGRPNPFAPIGTDVVSTTGTQTGTLTQTNGSEISGTVGASSGTSATTSNLGTSSGSKKTSGTSNGTSGNTTTTGATNSSAQ